VGQRIERLLQRPLATDEIALSGVVAREGNGWSLQLRIAVQGAPDERSLAAESCEVLADTAALVAAVLLDPVATTEAIDVDTVVERETVPARTDPAPMRDAVPKRVRAPAPQRVGEPRRRVRDIGVWTRVRGGGEIGAIPGGTGGLELALAIGTRRLRGEIAGSYWVGRSVSRDTSSLRVHLGTVAPRVCGLLVQRRIDITTCGGVELGVMRADVRGDGARQPLWLAIVAELGVRWPATPRVSLWVSAMPFVPVVQPEFELRDPDDPARRARVYRPFPVGVRGLAGVEVRLRGLDKR
jgi:hypothetical protein